MTCGPQDAVVEAARDSPCAHLGGVRRSGGCSGTTIAEGLRDLGITIPIVLVVSAGKEAVIPADATIRVVDASSAATVVDELSGTRASVARPDRPKA